MASKRIPLQARWSSTEQRRAYRWPLSDFFLKKKNWLLLILFSVFENHRWISIWDAIQIKIIIFKSTRGGHYQTFSLENNNVSLFQILFSVFKSLKIMICSSFFKSKNKKGNHEKHSTDSHLAERGHTGQVDQHR